MAADRRPAQARSSQDPAVLGGTPVITGTRIAVEVVLGQLAHTLDLDDLLAAYPALTRADVQVCLAFAQTAVQRTRRPRSLHQLLVTLQDITPPIWRRLQVPSAVTLRR